MYYAFFAPPPTDKNTLEPASWSGEIELRGLAPGKYHIVDYPNNRDLGSVTAPNARLTTTFSNHLLLEVAPE
jgi:hypothetical protein